MGRKSRNNAQVRLTVLRWGWVVMPDGTDGRDQGQVIIRRDLAGFGG